MELSNNCSISIISVSSRSEAHDAAILRINSSKNRYIVTLFCACVSPFHLKGCLSNDSHQVHHGVFSSQTVVRTITEHHEILGMLFRSSLWAPTIGIESVRIRINNRIMKGRIGGRDNHGCI